MTQAEARRRLLAAWLAEPPSRRRSARDLEEFLWRVELEHPEWCKFRARVPQPTLMRA